MIRRPRRAGVALVATLAILALFASACGGGEGDGASGNDGAGGTVAAAEYDTVIAIEVIDGEPFGGSRQVDVGLGDRVQVVLAGNTDDQVHVHGYDLFLESDDGAGELVFDAIIPGTFEVELEASSRLLLRMTVS